jgi:molybdopterin converting factor small subunit
MDIILKLMGGLKKYNHQTDNNKNIELYLDSDSKVSDIVNQLNITKEYIALVTVNKKVSDLNYKLKDGDKVVFYPPIGGG